MIDKEGKSDNNTVNKVSSISPMLSDDDLLDTVEQRLSEDVILNESEYKKLHFKMVERINDYLFERFEVFFTTMTKQADDKQLPITPKIIDKYVYKVAKLDMNNSDYKKAIKMFNKKYLLIYNKAGGDSDGTDFPKLELNMIKRMFYNSQIKSLIKAFFDLLATRVFDDIEYVKKNKIVKGEDFNIYRKLHNMSKDESKGKTSSSGEGRVERNTDRDDRDTDTRRTTRRRPPSNRPPTRRRTVSGGSRNEYRDYDDYTDYADDDEYDYVDVERSYDDEVNNYNDAPPKRSKSKPTPRPVDSVADSKKKEKEAKEKEKAKKDKEDKDKKEKEKKDKASAAGGTDTEEDNVDDTEQDQSEDNQDDVIDGESTDVTGEDTDAEIIDPPSSEEEEIVADTVSDNTDANEKTTPEDFGIEDKYIDGDTVDWDLINQDISDGVISDEQYSAALAYSEFISDILKSDNEEALDDLENALGSGNEETDDTTSSDTEETDTEETDTEESTENAVEETPEEDTENTPTLGGEGSKHKEGSTVAEMIESIKEDIEDKIPAGMKFSISTQEKAPNTVNVTIRSLPEDIQLYSNAYLDFKSDDANKDKEVPANIKTYSKLINNLLDNIIAIGRQYGKATKVKAESVDTGVITVRARIDSKVTQERLKEELGEYTERTALENDELIPIVREVMGNQFTSKATKKAKDEDRSVLLVVREVTTPEQFDEIISRLDGDITEYYYDEDSVRDNYSKPSDKDDKGKDGKGKGKKSGFNLFKEIIVKSADRLGIPTDFEKARKDNVDRMATNAFGRPDSDSKSGKGSK